MKVINLRPLSERDRELLALLIEDGRVTWTEAANRLGVSRVAVQNRVAALTESGWIKKFTVHLANPHPIKQGVDAFLRIKFSEEYDCFRLFNKFGNDKLVIDAWSLTGKWDAMFHIRAKQLEEISAFREMIVSNGGIKKIETEAILNNLKN